MTCIAGLETKDGVIMGCDSAAVSNWDIYQTRLKKICRKDNLLIGFAGSFRLGQLLQYQLELPPQKTRQSDLEYLATTVINEVRKCLSEGGYAKVDKNVEEGGFFLVGFKNKIYKINVDYQVNSSIDGFMAIGCGADYALGSLYMTKKKPPRQRIMVALEAAGHFSNGVSPPYYIKTLK